ncbi:MAG: DUF1684 domain-containing protein [Actinomycetota bacterium]|nr:DUF1684 domain-containing protein [Actinomycetota bacterium]
MTESAHTAVDVVSWRTGVHDLYAEVRAEPEPRQAHALWVAHRSAMFLEHPASPRLGQQRLHHGGYDPAYRFEVPLVEAEPEDWTYATGTDGEVPFVRVGRFELGHLGALDAWWLESYGGGLFVPLRDGSAGDTSYGAGRYLLDTVKGADLGRADEDRWVLDLNFAYNPSCAYDPRWACPLAPAGNRIDRSVPVGELTPG